MFGGIFAAAGAEEAGVGLMVWVIWAIVLIVGIRKCISISRRPTTSKLCVTSLTFALFVYLVPAVRAMLQVLVPGSNLNLVTAMLGMTVNIVSIAGLTLGIVGLADYRTGAVRKGRVVRYRQGKSQAGWGIALNILFLVIFMSAFLTAYSSRMHPLPKLQMAENKGPAKYEFKDKNFRLLMSGNGWVEMDAKHMMEDSSLVFMQRNPSVYVAVIAEKLGVELDLTSDKLVEVSQANIRAISPSAEISSSMPEARNGLQGERFSATLSRGMYDLSYEYWCVYHNGYGYQVMVWSKQSDRQAMRRIADQVFSGFELVDLQRRYYSSGNNSYGIFSSKVFPYSINLEGTGWLDWESLAKRDPIPDSGGHHPGGTYFTITPVYLPLQGTSIDQLRQSFLDFYQIDDGSILKPSEPVQISGAEGCTLSLQQNGTQYIEYILMAPNSAYLLSVWCPASKAGKLPQRAQEVLNAFAVDSTQVDSSVLQMLSGAQVKKQAQMINQIGLTHYQDGRCPESLEWFRSARSLDPADPAYLGNLLAAYQRMGRNQEGLDFLASMKDNTCRDNEQVKSLEASLLCGVGRGDEADAIYEGLFAAGYRNDDDLMAWTRLRADNGQWDDLDRMFANYAAKDLSIDLRVHQMGLYWDKEDYQRVVDLTKESESNYGFSPNIAYWAVNAYQKLGLYKEALAVCEQLLERNYKTVDVYQKKAASEYGLKWHRQAKESLEEALRLNPRNEDTKKWLQLVSAELGEGSNSVLKEAIDPVAMPKEVESLLQLDAPKDFGDKFGAYYDRLLVLWNYDQDQRLRRTDVQRIKLLDNVGVSTFSSLEYTFDPLSQDIFVNQLLVKNEDGEIVSQGAVKDYYVTDDSPNGMVSEKKRLVIPVPGLQPGYCIEIEITRDYPVASEEFYFENQYLAAGFPVLNAAVYLEGDASQIASVGLNGVESRQLGEGRLWMNEVPYTYRWEPLQIPACRFVPGVVLGPQHDSWEDCGKEYLDKIAERLGSTGKLREKTEALIADCNTEEDKYKAIVGWIRSSFTYKPLEFGRSAYMPDCAVDTLSHRYGDCKDLAVLLTEMLGIAGIDAELALVNTTSDVIPEIITTDQFNHMIAYVPDLLGGFFVDPTDQNVDAFLTVPANLQKCQALVLDPDRIRLETIPDYPPDSSSCTIARTIAVEGNLLMISDHISLGGYYASWMRSGLKEQQKINWVKWVQQYVADFVPDLEVKTVSASNLSETEKDLQLMISYVLPHAIHGKENTLSVKIPSIWANYYLSAQPVPDRKSPFCLTYPFSFVLNLNIAPPEEYELKGAIWAESSGNSAFIDWKTDLGGLRSEGCFQATLKPGDFVAGQYAEYVSAMNEAVRSTKLDINMIKASAIEAEALTDNSRPVAR